MSLHLQPKKSAHNVIPFTSTNITATKFLNLHSHCFPHIHGHRDTHARVVGDRHAQASVRAVQSQVAADVVFAVEAGPGRFRAWGQRELRLGFCGPRERESWRNSLVEWGILSLATKSLWVITLYYHHIWSHPCDIPISPKPALTKKQNKQTMSF